jgi:hypothetical protein
MVLGLGLANGSLGYLVQIFQQNFDPILDQIPFLLQSFNFFFQPRNLLLREGEFTLGGFFLLSRGLDEIDRPDDAVFQFSEFVGCSHGHGLFPQLRTQALFQALYYFLVEALNFDVG